MAMRMNVLSDLLSVLFERDEAGRKGGRWSGDRLRGSDRGTLARLCEELLAEGKDDASGMPLAAELLERYEGLDEDGRVGFFELLADELDVDPEAVSEAALGYARERDAASYARLQQRAESKRHELLRRLNRLPGATGRLVRMRAELLELERAHPRLAVVDADFEHLFRSWFNRGFLVMRRIDWSMPAQLLEKLIEYEAVHAIGDWDELRRRLQPPDRRCFAFFHPALPDDPLIFVEVALTDAVPDSIETLLSPERAATAPADVRTAVFYSISNCQPGLAGISFGNALIKQVAADIAAELPRIGTFVTLSPVPRFGAWLADQPSEDEPDLAALAAHYLVNVKRADGQPLDPVARFHLGNGASLEAVHTDADRSDNALAASRGVMVNYVYDLERVDARHESYVSERIVHASRRVTTLATRHRRQLEGRSETRDRSPA